MKIHSLITFGLIITALVFAIPASASYTITLKNGEELQAEGYKIEGEYINLKFRHGSAAFPKNLVKTISGSGLQGAVNQPAPSPLQGEQPPQPLDMPVAGQPVDEGGTLGAGVENTGVIYPDEATQSGKGDPGEGGETQ